MASSQVTEVQLCSSKEQEPQGASSKPSTLSHNIPIPQNLDKSKLDWLLQINEQFFEAELRTVVSTLPSIDYFVTYITIVSIYLLLHMVLMFSLL